MSPVSYLLLAEQSLQRVPGAQGDEEGLGEAQEYQEDTLEAEDKVAGHWRRFKAVFRVFGFYQEASE